MINASLVKELREKTGAGMMDCKKALTECGGDLNAAADWLREKGIAKAAKKATRIAAEGLSVTVKTPVQTPSRIMTIVISPRKPSAMIFMPSLKLYFGPCG